MLTIFTIFVLTTSFGQDEDFYSSEQKAETKKEHKGLDKWSFGGNFWMGFGSTTYIELSPVAMYKLHPRLMIGPGATYIYQNYRNWGISSSTYGVKAIGTFSVFKNLNESIHINIGDIILHSEYEALNIEIFDMNFDSMGRRWIDNLLVGGGIYQPLGDRGGMSVLLLFDVTQDPYSPYTNPILRLGFYF